MPPTLDRRQVLGGGVLLVAAWTGAFVVGHWPGAPDTPSPSLGASARATLASALEVLLPDPEMAQTVAADVDTALAADPVGAAQLTLALQALEHLGGAGLFTFTTFSSRDREERRAILDAWADSRLAFKRQVFAAMRRLAAFAWYARPESWAAIGYDGPWVGR